MEFFQGISLKTSRFKNNYLWILNTNPENTSSSGNFSVVTGNNSNTYQQSGIISGALPVLTETFDVDGDGKIDYVFGEASNLKILKNTSSQFSVHNNFAYSVLTIASSVNIKGLVYSDMNNDGKQDILSQVEEFEFEVDKLFDKYGVPQNSHAG